MMNYKTEFKKAFYDEMLKHRFLYDNGKLASPPPLTPEPKFIRAQGIMFQSVFISSWNGTAKIEFVNYPFWDTHIALPIVFSHTYNYNSSFYIKEKGFMNSRMLFQRTMKYPDFSTFLEAAREEYTEHLLPRLDATLTLNDYLRVWCFDLPQDMISFMAEDEAAICKTRIEGSLDYLKKYVCFKESHQRCVSKVAERTLEINKFSATDWFVPHYYEWAQYHKDRFKKLYGFEYEIEEIE